MSRSMRVAVLVSAVTSLLGVLPSFANAVTWHNTGSTVFTATSGPLTLSATGSPLVCSGISSATGSLPTTTVGSTLRLSATATFSLCTLGTTASFECGLTFTGTFQPPGFGTTDVNCDIYEFGFKICHIGGTVLGSYENPTGAVAGRLDLTTGGNLVLSNGTSGTCPLGPGEAAHLSALTFRVTSGIGGPIITRTS